MNADAYTWNLVCFLEEDEGFRSEVMEHEEQLGITIVYARSNATNEVSINLFTLQLTRQAEDDAEEHHFISGPSTYSPSEEGLPQMDQMEYKKMVVEA